jgi:hypothetical protein
LIDPCGSDRFSTLRHGLDPTAAKRFLEQNDALPVRATLALTFVRSRTYAPDAVTLVLHQERVRRSADDSVLPHPG